MDLSSIKLTNFFSHQNTDIKLTGGLVGVFGPNGAGKSSLIADSVTWCLWGKSRVGGAGDACISTGQAFCEVALTFRVNGTLWKVIRTRARDSKTVLELSVWKLDRWDERTGATLKDTQLSVCNLLGMSYEVFRNSSCIEQGHANSFSSLTPAEAANVILDILQLNKYKQYRQLAAEKALRLGQTVSGLLVSIKSLEGQLATYQDSTVVQKQKLEKSGIIQSQYDQAFITLTETERQEKDVLSKTTALSTVQANQDAKLSLLEKQLTKTEGHLKLLSSKVAGQCPLCKTTLNAVSLEESQKTLEKSIADLTVERQSIYQDSQKTASDIAEYETQLRNLKADSQRNYVRGLENELRALKSDLATLGYATASYDTIAAELASTKELLSTANSNFEIYHSLQEAFGPKGIPLLVVDNVVKELEIAINNNLKLLADLPLSISIATQHESSKGDMVDTFEIVLNDGLEAKPYVNYSGGEKMIIDLAIRLGLSELLAKRNNFKVETLIIDEGLGSLDEANQLNFFTTLAKLEAKFKHILVITHTQVKDCFKQRIELSKINGITLVDKQGNYRV